MLKTFLMTLFVVLGFSFSIHAAQEYDAAEINEFVYDANEGLLLDTPYTNVTFVVVDINANYRIHEKSVMNDCFKPRLIENCSGIFTLIKLSTQYGVIESLVFERRFPKNKVTSFLIII